MSPARHHQFLGFGLGLRSEHYTELLDGDPHVDWLEVLTENFLVAGGKAHYFLEKISEKYPVVMHGVSLSIGSTDPLNMAYLQQVKALAAKIKPQWISDHLCWTGVQGMNSHDLLPLPYTEEAIRHVVGRIEQVQAYLGERLVIENVSSYLTFKQSGMTEWEFLTEICERADCDILLDVNNIFVSSVNHGFDPLDYLFALPGARIRQIHLAGHTQQQNHLIDTHDASIAPAVWELYAGVIKRWGNISTMIERDANIPPLAELLVELTFAREIAARSLGERTT